MIKNSIMVFFLVSGWAQAQPSSSIQFRNDLYDALSTLVCSKESSPTMQDLWNIGIFDAGLKVYQLKPALAPNTQDRLNRLGRELAQNNNHRGFLWGQCSAQRHFIATTPSPQNFTVKKGRFNLNTDTIRHHCHRMRIDYAHAFLTKPRKILSMETKKLPKQISLDLNLLDRGTLGITCKPKVPQWQGTELWALFPVGLGPLEKPIQFDFLKTDQSIQHLSRWVNHVRTAMNLKRLSKGSIKVEELAKPLIQKNQTIMHNRRQLKQISKKFKKINGRFLGENRVKSRDTAEMAWLLWNSPRHRSLLLSKKATHLTTLARKIKDEDLAVLVFAKF